MIKYIIYVAGIMCDVKIIGGIDTRDESGQDDKIIAVLADHVDPRSRQINNIKDVNMAVLGNIEYFLKRYKDNEKNKKVFVEEFYPREKALEIIKMYSL
jgi:inorganic pyrophosphatase